MKPIAYAEFKAASPRWKMWMVTVTAGLYAGALTAAEIDAAAEASADPLERLAVLLDRCTIEQCALIHAVLSADWEGGEECFPPN